MNKIHLLCSLFLSLFSTWGATIDVQVRNNFFSPATVNIAVGDTVRWTWIDGGTHDVVANDGSFNSGLHNRNFIFTRVFNSVGNFNYFCTPHRGVGMTGVVRVTAPNQPPTVSITSPTEGALVSTTQEVTVAADASDPDGTVASVQFFDGTLSLGTDTSAPFSITTTFAQGAHSLTAHATDNRGALSVSAVVSIAAQVPNQTPAVAITSPSSGATFATTDQVTITANATDDGGVAIVQFFDGGTLLGTDDTSPYSFTKSFAAGTYNLIARVTDNLGAVSVSQVVTITVSSANQVPTVSIASPSAGKIVATNQPVTFTATASDPEGQLSRVEFLNGAAVIGTVNTPPYTFTTTTLPVGLHTITALAVDTQGGTGTSSAITVQVITRPKIDSIERISPTQVRLAITATGALDYTLQSNADLSSSNWSDVTTYRQPRGQQLITRDITGGQLFFRVILK